MKLAIQVLSKNFSIWDIFSQRFEGYEVVAVSCGKGRIVAESLKFNERLVSIHIDRLGKALLVGFT